MQASLNKPAVTSHLGLQIIQYQFSVTNPDTKFHISVKTENRMKAQRQTDSYEMNTITVRNSVTIWEMSVGVLTQRELACDPNLPLPSPSRKLYSEAPLIV